MHYETNCTELSDLRKRFIKVYGAFPFLNNFYTKEEIERSLKTIKCDVVYIWQRAKNEREILLYWVLRKSNWHLYRRYYRNFLSMEKFF